MFGFSLVGCFFFPKHFLHLLGGSIETSYTSFLFVQIPHVRDSYSCKRTIFLSLLCWLWIIIEVQCFTDMFFARMWSALFSCSGILYSILAVIYSITSLPQILWCALLTFSTIQGFSLARKRDGFYQCPVQNVSLGPWTSLCWLAKCSCWFFL